VSVHVRLSEADAGRFNQRYGVFEEADSLAD